MRGCSNTPSASSASCDGEVISDSQPKEAAVGKFLLLAFRNIFRNRRRTIMTLFMVGGGVAGLLLAGGYFAFMTHGLREDTINNGLGHLQIFTADHFKRDEVRVLDTGIENWRQVAANRQVGSTTCAALLPASTSTAWSPTEPRPPDSWAAPSIRTRKTASAFHHISISGSDLDPKPSPAKSRRSSAIGLAKSMNVKVGDGLTMLAMTSDGALNGVDVQIVGIVNSGVARNGCALSAHHPARRAAPAAKRSRHQSGGRPGFHG